MTPLLIRSVILDNARGLDMSILRCSTVALVLAGVLLTGRMTSGADRPLGEDAIISLIELQIEDSAIIAKMKKAGISFEPDQSALDRLSQAGASEALLDAIRESGASKKKPEAGEKAVTFEDILKLLELGIDDAAIL